MHPWKPGLDDKMTLKDLTEAKGLPLGGRLDELNNLGYH